jgi:AraC-like DNA-binding protein
VKPTLIQGDMRYWRLPPDERLRPHVLCYYVVEPAHENSLALVNEPKQDDLLLPDGHAEIVLCLDGRFERWPIGESAPRAVMHTSYLIGGRSHSVVTRNLTNIRLVGVKLDPRSLRALIAIPLSELRDSTLTLRDLNIPALLHLEDAVAGARSIDEIATVLNRFFLNTLCNRRRCEARDVNHLLRRVRAARGMLSIMDWVGEQKIDSRSLERRFCAWTGMTPKQYARIVRFKHCYHRLISGGQGHGTISSLIEGYCDQSHFNRDFKYFTGSFPSARMRGTMQRGTSVTDHLIEAELPGVCASDQRTLHARSFR